MDRIMSWSGRARRDASSPPASPKMARGWCCSKRAPPDRDIWIHIPAGVLRVLNNPKITWNFLSEGEPGTAGRMLQWPRGKTLGGTSSINGMLYVRGNPADYDGWAQMGCRGWSYDEVLPFFRKSETYRGAGDPEYRSRGGPLIVEDYRTILPLTHSFVEAAQQAGFPFTPDYNGKSQEGVAYSQMTRRGRLRGSTARTFLAQARGRANLRVETDAIVTRLLFDGKRCTLAFRQKRRRAPAACGARSHRLRWCGQLAALVADFRDWAGRPSAADRRSGRARPAGCRRQPQRSLRHSASPIGCATR